MGIRAHQKNLPQDFPGETVPLEGMPAEIYLNAKLEFNQNYYLTEITEMFQLTFGESLPVHLPCPRFLCRPNRAVGIFNTSCQVLTPRVLTPSRINNSKSKCCNPTEHMQKLAE